MTKSANAMRAAMAALLLTAAACASPEQRVANYTKSGTDYLDKDDLGRANVQFQNALKINEEYLPALEGLAEIAEKRQDFQGMFGILQRIVRLDPQNADAHVKMGKLLLISSDESGALEAADKALSIDPESADALALKAAVRLKLDDAAGAVDLARQALAVDPANVEAVAVVAAERSKAGDHKAALAEIDALLEKKPETAVLQLLRIELLTKLGREDEVLAAHQNLIELFPDTTAYRQLYAGYLIRKGETQKARKELEEIVRLSPGEVAPILDVVRLDYREGGAEAAKNTFARYVEAQSGNVDLQFSFAAFLRQEGDMAGAEAIYNGLAARKGDMATTLRARNEIAAIRLVEGKTDEAQAIVDQILKADVQHTGALLTRAGLKIEAGDHDGAVADLRAVLADKPDSLQAKMLMASAFEKKGDIPYATRELAEAINESGKASGPSNAFAKFLIRNGDSTRAETVLLESLAAHPGNLDNLKLLASLRLMRQDWRGAEETAHLIEAVAAEEPVVNNILGAAYSGLGDFAGAIEALSEENARAPLATRPLAMLVSAYVKEGRAEEAEKLLRSMIASDGANYDARLLLAQVLFAAEKSDDAEAALKAAIAADPKRAEAREALYRAYQLAGRGEKALGVIEDGLALTPENDGLHMLRADYLLSKGDKAGALAIYEDVLTRRPGDLLASNNYASLMNELKTDPQSREKALQAAEALQGQENPFFLDTLGWARFQAGDVAGAVKALEAAHKAAPTHVEIAYHLGAAYLAAGETEKGRAALGVVLGAGETPFLAPARDLLAQN
ncbi:MAG: tetratricopeptide repeat protein [Amphiplicatus sp.]